MPVALNRHADHAATLCAQALAEEFWLVIVGRKGGHPRRRPRLSGE
jgi:hypothetical protein